MLHMAPTHTDDHLILASGKNLNISANTSEIIARENTKLSNFQYDKK